MSAIMDTLVQKLKEHIPEAVTAVHIFRDETTLEIERSRIVAVVRFLRDNEECPFEICEDVCGVDRFERKDRFEVVYHLFSLRCKERIALKVRVDIDDCVVPSITAIYPGANWYERETFDMFGIRFSDHPDLRRVYMPEDFEYYPLRKDFPLMGIPGSIPLPKR